MDSPPEATGAPQEPPKKLGRPKGSKNRDRASEGIVEITNSWVPSAWCVETNEVGIKLASEHAPDGLDSVIKKEYVVGVSALPNGMASIITNIGTNQPFILVTAEPYSDVVGKLFPGVK